jgi:hypothetical protein
MSLAVSAWDSPVSWLWPAMVAVYNAIGLPFLVLQLRYDSALDARFTPYTAYSARMLATLLTLAGISFWLPALADDPHVIAVLCATGIVGIAVAGAYTWLFQLATFYHNRSVAWALGGVGMCSVLFLFVMISQHFSFEPPALWLYWMVAQVFTCCGLCSIGALLRLPISKSLLSGETKQTLRQPLLDTADASVNTNLVTDSPIIIASHATSNVDSPQQPKRLEEASLSPAPGAGASNTLTAKTAPAPTSQLLRRIWALELCALLINLTVVGLAAAVTGLPHKMWVATLYFYLISACTRNMHLLLAAD